MLDWNTWNCLTVYKQMSSGLFKMLPKIYLFRCYIYVCVYVYIYIYIYIYKQDLALNNLQVMLKSPKLSNDEFIQFLNGWSLK